MAFPLAEFNEFCEDLTISTKEAGQIQLGAQFLGTQKRVRDEMAKGFDEGVHDFVILKCRQIGISTFTNALDLYWPQKFPGIVGMLVTQDDATRDSFRETLKMYYEGLPDDWQLEIRAHNRNQLVLDNGSMLLYRVAGTKITSSSGNLGRSAAPSFIHATEVAKWADPEGIASLRSAMSEYNPNRLYVWESTAAGFNSFWRMWLSAKEAVSQRAIFVSWWANEYYRTKKGSDIWNAYWGGGGRATEEEKRRAKEVKLLYGIDIVPEQIAWYRWYETEKASGNDMMAMQEFPWTENEAFVATGSRFFSTRAIGDFYRIQRSMDPPQYFRLQFGNDFRVTTLLETVKSSCTMEVYEEPVKGGYYVLGADPAYGSSENADRFVASVWRCYADRMVQVCEFVDPGLAPHQFAWVIVYLAGAYDPCLINLEINGPGQAVDNEISNLQKQLVFTSDPSQHRLRNVLAGMRTYLFRRPDGMSSGPIGRHTISTSSVKERYMGEFKDYAERGMMDIGSRLLIDEMQNFERSDGGSLEAGAKGKDDRCIAAGLSVMAWNDSLRTMLMQRGVTYEAVHRPDTLGESDPTSRVLGKYLIDLGVIQKPKQVIQGARAGIPRDASSRNQRRRSR